MIRTSMCMRIAWRRICPLPLLARADALHHLFFFSSRRRHTRYIGDWSSDVCSSDLPAAFTPGCTVEAHQFAEATAKFKELGATVIGVSHDPIEKLDRFSVSECRNKRSEERRVGKECRYRWSPSY